jgi:ATP-dependent Clp protease ATP-binding subunit ClpB
MLTPDARARLADEGYEPAFGARPLKRAVQRLLQNPLAMAVLEGRFKEGDVIVADVNPTDDGLMFRHGDAADAAAIAAMSPPTADVAPQP